MPQLKPQPTLADFQRYVAEMVKERGFAKGTVPEVFMLFLEECGELAKAARKFTSAKMDLTDAREHRLDHEAADVFIYMLDICNKFGIDLEKAFREKEAHNATRQWDTAGKQGFTEIAAPSIDR